MLYPAPRLGTRVKVRWDDSRLYVGAYIEETDLWGVITEDDTPSKFEHPSPWFSGVPIRPQCLPLDTYHAAFYVTLIFFNFHKK